jgi:hypothetical protein
VAKGEIGAHPAESHGKTDVYRRFVNEIADCHVTGLLTNCMAKRFECALTSEEPNHAG